MARGESSAISPGVPQPGLLDRPGRRWLRLHPVGLAVGTAFAVLAMTPSLVPRDWVFQGVVSGISAAVGYGVGVILVWMLGRSARWRRVSDRVRRRLPRWVPASAWVVLLILVPVALGAMLVIAAGWQRQITALMGMEQTTTTGWSRAGPLLVVV
ncbi:MAG: alpha/beta-hydrolase N-terminal domain-containing protein, partial [Pseudonocardiaceae bacterium]